jgi:RNA ligase (TIGR02306 family)
MTSFAVTIEQIGAIREHTNADRLEMATLKGKDYDFVVLKGQFQQGDSVVYFPVDSILPEWITDILGLTGKLTGKEQNRVKTIKLRGNVSQGVVASPHLFADHAPEILSSKTWADVTTMLGVEKYDPPPIPLQYGDLKPLPDFVSKYDIVSAQNHVELVTSLLDEPVYITEKLEGSHWSVMLNPETSRIAVSQRNYRIEPNDKGEHLWHKMARIGNYAEKLQAIATEWESIHGRKPKAVTIRGEMLGPGVHDNYYKLKDHVVYVFEIEIDGKPLDAAEFLTVAERYALPTVPILAQNIMLRDWLGEKTLKQASDGQSALANMLREGIVIKPMRERQHEMVGRVFIKQRSPEYLSKSEY